MNGIKSLTEISTCLENNHWKLRIPSLQRGYVWDRVQWEQLWTDIMRVWDKHQNQDEEDTNPQHFMGVLTLQKVDNQTYDILDGQQRMTTLKILTDYLGDLIRYKNKSNAAVKTLELPIEQLNVNDASHESLLNNDVSKEIYAKVYNSFAEFYARSGEMDPEKLLELISCCLFWLVDVMTEAEDAHQVFEAINATGEPLEYADQLLNYLLERKQKESGKGHEEEVVNRWTKIINNIYKDEEPEDIKGICADGTDDEEDLEETEAQEEEASAENTEDQNAGNAQGQKIITKPLKLKKFLSVLHCLTLPRTESVRETVEDFEAIFERLRVTEGDASLDVNYILSSMESWAKLYLMYLNPCSGSEFDEFLYKLNILGNTSYIPMILRMLRKCKKCKEDGIFELGEVKAAFDAVIRYEIYANVYIERDNSREAEKKIILLDYIVEALKREKKKISMPGLFHVICDKKEAKEKVEKDWKIAENAKTFTDLQSVKFLRFPYHSKLSKLILVIDHERNAVKKEYLWKLEKKENPFQVEHMVPRKLECPYSTYGCDDILINQFWNLILLERSINITVSNHIPEEKLSFAHQGEDGTVEEQGWKKSVLYDFYKPYINEIALNPQMKFMEMQTDRMKKLAMAIGDCLMEAINGKAVSYSKILPILQMERHLGQYTGVVSKIDVTTETASEDKYLFVIESSHVKRYPIPSNNAAVNYYYTSGSLRETATDKELALLQFVQLMLNGAADDEVYTLISEYTKEKCKIGDKGKKGKNTILFTNENIEKEQIHVDDRLNKKVIQPKDTPSKCKILTDGRQIYLNTDTNVTEMEKQLPVIYERYCELVNNDPSKLFGYWIEMKDVKMIYVDGIRKLLPFRNIGDNEQFHAFVKGWEKENGLESVKTSLIVQNVKSYFTHDEIRYQNLVMSNYKIPVYQRAYVWDNVHFESLWNSIELSVKRGSIHLGTIVLYGDAIVDGQQRLTTLSVLYELLMDGQQIPICDSLCDAHKENVEKARKFFRDKLKNINDRKAYCNAVRQISFLKLQIDQNAPRIYQYTVFSAINGKGKKLTVQEKVKNWLLKHYSVSEKAVDLKNVSWICETTGFIKAFAEYKAAQHIAEKDLYREFKNAVIDHGVLFKDLKKACKVYRYIKGMSENTCQPAFLAEQKDDENYTQFFIYLKLYQQLSVDTADALLLHHFLRWEDQITHAEAQEGCAKAQVLAEATDLLKRLDMLYFLLYVDDPNGNDKKSVNSKLPKLIRMHPNKKIYTRNHIQEGESAQAIISDDVLHQSGDCQTYVWDKLLATDLVRTMRVNVSRFILMMVEIWMGVDSKQALECLDLKFMNKCDVEHIFPANKEDIPDGVLPPRYLYRLGNVCLLESKINRSIGNNMLYEIKLKTIKNEKQPVSVGKLEQYKDSKFHMPHMFYTKEDPAKMNPDYLMWNDQVGYYTDDAAKKRLETIRQTVIAHGVMKADLELVIETNPI